MQCATALADFGLSSPEVPDWAPYWGSERHVGELHGRGMSGGGVDLGMIDENAKIIFWSTLTLAELRTVFN